MFNFCSLYSGSSGNCLLVQSDNTKVLFDAGVSSSGSETEINGGILPSTLQDNGMGNNGLYYYGEEDPYYIRFENTSNDRSYGDEYYYFQLYIDNVKAQFEKHGVRL